MRLEFFLKRMSPYIEISTCTHVCAHYECTHDIVHYTSLKTKHNAARYAHPHRPRLASRQVHIVIVALQLFLRLCGWTQRCRPNASALL